MATVANLYCDQGSDFAVIVTLKNQDGTAINLTNYEVYGQFRKSFGSTAYTNFVVTIYSAIAGQIKIELSAATSSLIKPGRYLYDIEGVYQGQRKRVLEGIFAISPEITR